MRIIVLNNKEKRQKDLYAINPVRKSAAGILDTLTFTTVDSHIAKYNRLLFRDGFGQWHEYIVIGISQYHDENGISFEVYAENSLTELKGEFIEDSRIIDGTAELAVQKALQHSRWEYQVDNLGIQTLNFYRCSAWDALSQISKAWKCEFDTKIEIAGNRIIRRTLIVKKWIGSDLGRRFSWSKDIRNIRRRVEDSDIITALYGFGKGIETEGGGYGRRLDFSSLNEGKMYIADESLRTIYGKLDSKGVFQHRFGVEIFEDIEDTRELFNATKARLEEISKPSVTYEAEVVDLSSLGLNSHGIQVGDLVTVHDQELQIALKARVLEMEEYLDHESENKIVIGNYKPLLGQNIRNQEEKLNRLTSKEAIYDRARFFNEDGSNVTYIDKVIENLNKQFSTGTSNVRFDPNRGLIITDKEDEEQSLWIMEIGSKGFRIANKRKSDGSWDFRTFGTGDGFTADEIISGHIDAGKITVGEAESKKSLAKALEELNLQDASVADILGTIQTQMVNRDEFVSAQESYNQAKEAYDKSLLDSQATDEEIQARLKDLDEARTSYETQVNDLNETLKVYEEALGNVTRSFRTDELGRPVISKPGSNTSLLLDNDGLYIQVAGSSNAYFTKDNMLVRNASIMNLNLGDHQIKVDADGKGFNIVNT